MKTSIKNILALSLFISCTITADPQLFIKNSTQYDIAIKFAAPEMKGQEVKISAGKDFSAGRYNPYEIKNLSVRRTGYGESLSRWVPIDVKSIYWLSDTILQKPITLPTGYERDIYWNIEATYTGWTAKVSTVARQK